MKLLTDLQNPDALKCLITSLVTGVKLEVTPVDLKANENKTPEFLKMSPLGFTPVLEVDRFNYLTDADAICRFLSSKQKKVPLIPEGFNGNKVDEWLEYAVTKELDFDFIEKSLSGKFLVGDHMTLADISIWSKLYPLMKEGKVDSKYSKLTNWFNELAKEKFFVNAVKLAGF